jgi:ATP-dependent exoDNAse (exonuclease V) alpha subunit
LYSGLGVAFSDRPESYLKYLKSRAILTPLNLDTWSLNREVLSNLPGNTAISTLVDRPDDDARNSLPPESLNKLDFPGFPKHQIELKIGAPIMLLRNLNIRQGLCNGTRLVILRLNDRAIEARIMTGKHEGNVVLLPKILLHHNGDLRAKLSFYRYQFPVVLCFSMTINKSQGQTLDHVALMLRSPVFAHGQLYVGLSRVTNPANLEVFTLDNTSAMFNVVNKEIFPPAQIVHSP